MSVTELSRRQLAWLYGATSLLGLLVTPPLANLYAVVGNVTVLTGLAAFLHWVATERTLGANRLIALALTSAGLPSALAAISTASNPAGVAIGFLLVAVAAMATIVEVEAYLRAPSEEADTVPATTALSEDARQGPALSTMSTRALLTRWRTRGSALDAVQLRADILDELERRDPVGVDRWIREGDAAKPAGYVGHEGLNAPERGTPDREANGAT